MKLTLIGTKQLEGDVRTFVFASDTPRTWVAGQFLRIILPHDDEDDRGHKRWFTISAAPSDGHMAISTRIVSEHPSSFKQALASLPLGTTVEAEEPEGDFILEDKNRNYIFVAGGIGITPFHSIIREAAFQKEMPKITLLYAYGTADVAFKQELEDIKEKFPNLRIEYILSPARIDKDLLQKTIASIGNPFVYVSGPEPMVEAFEKTLAEIGLAKDSIKTDFFPGYEAF